MKVKQFHQFIRLEKGPVNTALINFLKGDIFQAKNEIIDKFNNRKYGDIEDFIQSAQKEELIIEVDEKRWIPRLSFDNEIIKQDDHISFEVELEEGISFDLVRSLFSDFNVTRVVFYSNNKFSGTLSNIEVIQNKKDFGRCLELVTITSNFSKVNESFYYFNKNYNSCWGKKIAITKDGKIRPCIFSDIVFGDIEKTRVEKFVSDIQKYWHITKDQVEKCKDCELRYVCFDCREIARKESKDLYAANPYCKYNPYSGEWSE